jgi:hypothetical protein
MSNKCEDIIDLHAPLIHKAADIETQIAYDNGGNPATIDLQGKNVQRMLEEYYSLVGIPIKGELPTGAKNGVNLTYVTTFEFIPATLEVFLSGVRLNGDQSDPDRDYDIITVGPNENKSFTLRIDDNKPHVLNAPPFQNEGLYVNYGKRITFNTKGGN